MSAKTRPYRSGFCGAGNPPKSHARCPGAYDGEACACDCHAARRVGAAEVIEVEYRSPDWYDARREGIAASEIAAVLGISPWVSPFDLWWSKRTGQTSQAENRGMRRGRRYEGLILEDFAEEHPELVVVPSLTLRSIERPWQLATPDALAYTYQCDCVDPAITDDDPIAAEVHEPNCMPVLLAPIEAKTGQRWEWGDPGTDDIPVHYRAQVLWQMDVLGTNLAHIPVLYGGDQYAEYAVDYDEHDVALMRAAAEKFLESVREDRTPDVDDHTATLRRLKKLHPSIEPGQVEVPAAVVGQYHAARRLRDAAEARMRLAEARIRHQLGTYQTAVVDRRKVASRSVYDVKPRTQQVRGYTVNRLNFTRQR